MLYSRYVCIEQINKGDKLDLNDKETSDTNKGREFRLAEEQSVSE